MIYKPKHFRLEEFFPPAYIAVQAHKGDLIWLAMDARVLITCDRLRERYGPLQGNDYYLGGRLTERGYRPAINKTNKSDSISQHLFGRAQDLWPGEVSAEAIRNDILATDWTNSGFTMNFDESQSGNVQNPIGTWIAIGH